MPPGFGVLDSLLVAVPIFLALFGLVRGAPVELASCLGCVAGAAAAWIVSIMPLTAALGQPWGPLLCLAAGVVVWRLMRGISQRFGFDTRWVNFGTLFDSLLGFSMGGLRGVAFVSTGCLAYAMVFVPLGLANPMDTVAYPVFLALGSQVTSAVVTAAQPDATQLADNTASSFIDVPLPLLPPHLAEAQPATLSVSPPLPARSSYAAAAPLTAGVAVASLLHVIAPDAVAEPVRPPAVAQAYSRDIPVRGVPAWLIETRHNIAHPMGAFRRVRRHS